MKPKKSRICIYPKDVQNITGKSYRQSLRILHKIRTILRKQPHEWITVQEFCSYTGIPEKDIEHLL